ncbi:aminotransferase class IV [Tengunoibacter tsumagoiensis]|uniref:Branched chain amino acid aminotransferase n=1 Tax=Tengunoibacter tsumagoiensis TaxID=2014871 RepID=A0A402A1X6_9CHLR|nr:aminotransferase class IV [Tengunoibacter tsumagoiensis]GCE13153.1 branched chain amino acid aminotransferase [Tengunoibacter tsumagoiensis]
MDTSAWWYIDGQWVHPHEASLSINDVAILRGYSVFESLRTYHRRPFHLHEHLQRLYRSAQLIELELPYTPEFFAHLIQQVIERNVYEHASLRLLVTGGESEDGIMPIGKPVVAILITELPERDMERFARGVKLITTSLQRITPEAKTSNYISAIRSLKTAQKQGAGDALYVNEQGHVLESTKSNFFVFRGDTLITPREGVLIGITRNIVCELAQGRFALEERPILLEELGQIDEAFLTSSSREITPVVQINELSIGSGRPGPRTSELEQLFIELVERGDF